MLRGRALLTRLGGNLFDQGLAALSNVVLSVLVARSVDAEGFGSFSVAFLVYGIAYAAMRSVVGQPLQIKFSAAPPAELTRRTADALGTALLLALPAALVCAVIGLLLQGTTGSALLMLAIWLPGLLVQDTCRMAFFARQRPWSAAVIDGVWAAVQFGLMAALLMNGLGTLELLMGAWGIGALVAAVVGAGMLAVLPRLTAARQWLREQGTLSRYLLAEYVLGLGTVQFGILIVGVIATTEAVGSLRAAQVLLGPLGIVATAMFQFTVPEVARNLDMGAHKLQRLTWLVTGGLLAVHVVYVTALLWMPDQIGVQLFGDTWSGAAVVLLPMCLSACFSSMANGPAGVLYGLGWARETFWINVIKCPMILVLLIGGTYLWGALGSAWAFAAIEALILPLWIVTVIRASHHPRASQLTAAPA